MPDLFWPGDSRAGPLMTGTTWLEAMVQVERAWLEAMVAVGIAPGAAAADLDALVIGPDDVELVAASTEQTGTPVVPLLDILGSRLEGTETVRWLHLGLTSQDVVDTAVMLMLRDVFDAVLRELHQQVGITAELARLHRDTPMAGRTLTQHAIPITFGLKAAVWLTGLLDAADRVVRARSNLPAQFGGVAGSLAATVELARLRGIDDAAGAALHTADVAARSLGLRPRHPWHTTREPITSAADALATCSDAWGHIASDLTTLARPEVGELHEDAVSGSSSTVPGKRNPVLAVLIKRSAVATPQIVALLHLAAATTGDERPDGAWHTEWAALRDLGRHVVVAGRQATDLLNGLTVDSTRMAATLAEFDLSAEQSAIAHLAGHRPSGAYDGAAGEIIDRARARSREFAPLENGGTCDDA